MKIFKQKLTIPHDDRLRADFNSERYIEEARAALVNQIIDSEDFAGVTTTDFDGMHIELMLFTMSLPNWYEIRDFLQKKLSAEEFIEFKKIIEEK